MKTEINGLNTALFHAVCISSDFSHNIFFKDNLYFISFLSLLPKLTDFHLFLPKCFLFQSISESISDKQLPKEIDTAERHHASQHTLLYRKPLTIPTQCLHIPAIYLYIWFPLNQAISPYHPWCATRPTLNNITLVSSVNHKGLSCQSPVVQVCFRKDRYFKLRIHSPQGLGGVYLCSITRVHEYKNKLVKNTQDWILSVCEI